MLIVMAAIGCSAAAASRAPVPAARTTPTAATVPRKAPARNVRIALSEGVSVARLTSAGAWEIFGEDGRTPVALTQPGEAWLLESEGRTVRARREDSRPVTARVATMIARPLEPAGQISYNGRRYRGELVISALAGGLVVVNHLPMDDYLRGVVPLEIGTSSPGDAAAVEAQAVSARSYAITHLGTARGAFDMRATVADQVYGGANAETGTGNAAVRATTGLVLRYGGQVVNAPYYSTCGGSTAEPQDVWRAGATPYLKRVSDQVPGTTRHYCDAAPKYRWTRTFGGEELRESIARYLRGLPRGGASIAAIRGVTVTGVTPAGRVAVLTVETDRGSFALRGNDMRSALRFPSGELLYSTYFSVDAVADGAEIRKLTLHGGGHGHGVGMCQAGAIGRARAGQDFRAILQAYYPGTTVGTID